MRSFQSQTFLSFSSVFLLLVLVIQVSCKTQRSENHFHYGAHMIPAPEKAETGGEDAYYANNYILAVADGVGGWKRRGIDPAEYARTMCRLVGVLLEEDGNGKYHNNPKAIIEEAANRNTNKGSATFVIAYLDRENPILRTSYIGDSIYVIYRKQEGKWRILHEAEEHQRAFNYPYQISYEKKNKENYLEFSHQVEENDIVVVGSDGLFDNLTSEQVINVLLPFIDKKGNLKDPKEASNTLANAAYKLSLDQTYNSPFAQRAEKTKLKYIGGKSDDITVIVGQVKLRKSQGRKETSSSSSYVEHEL